MILEWNDTRSLENSLAEFLQDAVDTASLTVENDKGEALPIHIRVGYEFDEDWKLPVISFYVDTKPSPRGFVGSNARIKTYSMIVDIRAFNRRMQQDLTDWFEQTINDGFPFYQYTPSGDPENPTKVLAGLASLEFVLNIPLKFGDNVDLIDKYRQNITLSIFIENKDI